jgi:hypothetical protein
MKLTAIFEEWHLGDGNYPPLSKQDLVRLAFQMEVPPTEFSLEEISSSEVERFEHRGFAEYAFAATLLRVYENTSEVPLGVFEADCFRFYVEHRSISSLQTGRRYRGTGTLLLDYYIWTEFLEQYENPPDLFYNLLVTQILRVAIPERFINRKGTSKAMPSRATKNQVDAECISEVETMTSQGPGEEFYIVEFDDSGLEGVHVQKTFIL